MRAGTGGVAGTGGRSGSGGAGTGGAGMCVSAPPTDARTRSLGTTSVSPTDCGYNGTATSLMYSWPVNGTQFALATPDIYGNGAGCGRCVELVRSLTGNVLSRATVTVVGACDAARCPEPTASFAVSSSANATLTLNAPLITSLPQIGETLTYAFVGCPVPMALDGQPERIRADFLLSGGGIPNGVRFVGQRYGITSVSMGMMGVPGTPLAQANDAYWRLPNAEPFGTGAMTFSLVDTNQSMTSFSQLLANPMPYVPTEAQFPTCSP